MPSKAAKAPRVPPSFAAGIGDEAPWASTSRRATEADQSMWTMQAEIRPSRLKPRARIPAACAVTAQVSRQRVYPLSAQAKKWPALPRPNPLPLPSSRSNVRPTARCGMKPMATLARYPSMGRKLANSFAPRVSLGSPYPSPRGDTLP